WPAMRSPSRSEVDGRGPESMPAIPFSRQNCAPWRAILSRKRLWVLVLGSVWLLLPLPASAAERSVSDVVLVDAGAVIEDDLYAAGERVVVLGRIEGDRTVAAFEDVTIAGTVRGDVVGVAGSVIVTGTVTESVRVMAPTIEVTGEVGGDVVGVAWTTFLGGSVE